MIVSIKYTNGLNGQTYKIKSDSNKFIIDENGDEFSAIITLSDSTEGYTESSKDLPYGAGTSMRFVKNIAHKQIFGGRK